MINEARPRPRQDRDGEALPRTDGPRTGGGGGRYGSLLGTCAVSPETVRVPDLIG